MNDPIRTLELDEILNTAASYAVSPKGKASISSLRPSGDPDEVADRLTLTSQAERLLSEYRYGGVESFDDTDEILEKVRAGAILSMKELLSAATVLRSGRLAKAAMGTYPEDVDKIKDIALRIFADKTLEDDIRRDIISDTEMSDAASDTLRDIRARLRSMRNKLTEKLASYTRSNEYSSYLRDNFYTVRGGRYVLPVKSECRGSVPGLLHDQSATGSTMYIEPFEIVSMNNDIVRLEGDEQREIERILGVFSERVLAQADNIEDASERLALLDTYFGMARYGDSIDAIRPAVNHAGKVSLKGARHPLIPKDRVVPIDIEVGNGKNILLISGPNTGGKTASLKTVGLLSAMLACGLLIPCKEDSEMAVFDRIFCDIGDDQDISQNLSTFSSHIKNLTEIMTSFTNESLILLDEIGSSTSPDEGAALGIGVMEYIAETKAKAIITTHYPKLKEYAMASGKILNAGMQFDPDTLEPTYKILMGYPGVSNALETAKALGLPDKILATARRSMDRTENYETLLSEALTLKARAEEELTLAEEAKAAAERRLAKIAADEKKVNEALERINANAKAETKRLVNKAVDKANDIVEEIKRELKEADERALLKAKRDLKRLEALAYEGGETTGSTLTEDIGESEIVPGAKVVIKSIGAEGYVAKIRKDKKEAEVNCLGKSIKVGFADLAKPVIVSSPAQTRRRSAHAQPAPSAPASPVTREINVIGETVADAVDTIEPWLDNAADMRLTELRIVHGKGTGALGRGIQTFLRSHPAVKSFRYGRYGEGDMGVTIVELK